MIDWISDKEDGVVTMYDVTYTDWKMLEYFLKIHHISNDDYIRIDIEKLKKALKCKQTKTVSKRIERLIERRFILKTKCYNVYLINRNKLIGLKIKEVKATGC